MRQCGEGRPFRQGFLVRIEEADTTRPVRDMVLAGFLAKRAAATVLDRVLRSPGYRGEPVTITFGAWPLADGGFQARVTASCELAPVERGVLDVVS